MGANEQKNTILFWTVRTERFLYFGFLACLGARVLSLENGDSLVEGLNMVHMHHATAVNTSLIARMFCPTFFQYFAYQILHRPLLHLTTPSQKYSLNRLRVIPFPSQNFPSQNSTSERLKLSIPPKIT
jgi:hypothetical protein